MVRIAVRIAVSRVPGSRAPSSRELPARASLENLRNQAKTLLKQHREGQPEALRRVAEVLSGAQLPLKLHDAQLVLAREYGFASWPRLVEHLEPQARRLRDLGAGGREEIAPPARIDLTPRSVAHLEEA